MKTTYYESADILEIRVSEQPVAREFSHGWNVNIAYAAEAQPIRGGDIWAVRLDLTDL